jgi:hypothetical protein
MLMNELINEVLIAVVFEDNSGCIYLIRNQKTGSRTKHIAVRYLYGRELFQSSILVPYFVRSEANWSDGCTKHFPQKCFAEHEQVLMYGIMPYRREDVTMAIKSIESGSSSLTTGIPNTSPEKRQYYEPGTPTHWFWEESDRSNFNENTTRF